jgi:hypothetical protein
VSGRCAELVGDASSDRERDIWVAAKEAYERVPANRPGDDRSGGCDGCQPREVIERSEFADDIAADANC